MAAEVFADTSFWCTLVLRGRNAAEEERRKAAEAALRQALRSRSDHNAETGVRTTGTGARVTPRSPDTRYSATVEADLTAKVEVFRGAARVTAQGHSVEVPAGM